MRIERIEQGIYLVCFAREHYRCHVIFLNCVQTFPVPHHDLFGTPLILQKFDNIAFTLLASYTRIRDIQHAT